MGTDRDRDDDDAGRRHAGSGGDVIMRTTDQNKSLTESFAKEVFNNHNVQFLQETLADDFVEHEVAPGMTPDKQGAITWFTKMFTSFPDSRTEIQQMIASGDRVVIHSTFSGTDTGGFMPGMPATGKSFEMEGIDIIRVNDEGKIAEHWGIQDQMAMMGQLGLLPPPPEVHEH
jgi:steroid delta-isomerase-like uncharacterized protein